MLQKKFPYLELYFIKYLINIIPNYINNIFFYKNEITINVEINKFIYLMNFLQNNSFCKFKQLIDICGVDYPWKTNRFSLIYNLISCSYNFRLKVKIFTNEFLPIPTVSSLFQSSLWLEREVWDTFGIFFSKHKDLRRLLTDYGFEGYPFRKDFPQIGFFEIRYDEKKKHVIYEPVEIAQEFRFFNFSSAWLQVK